MSYPHPKPISIGDAFLNPAESIPAFDRALPFVQSTDSTIDVALRNVPLPDGFLSRLNRLASAMPDETSGQIDYLGC